MAADLVLRNARLVVTMDGARRELAGGWVAVTGGLVRLTDFEVSLYDAKAQRIRSWLRNGDSPAVVVTDPLQAHIDRLTKWTDADMHNVTAYLAGLK